jgi:sugar phosphate permease
MASVIVIGAGLPASFTGGFLSDKFEHSQPMIKGLISGLGALAACPFIVLTYIV